MRPVTGWGLVRAAQRRGDQREAGLDTGHSQLVPGKAWVLDASRRLWTKSYLAQALKILSLHRHKHCNSLDLLHLPVKSDSVCRHVRGGGDQDGCWEGDRFPFLAELSGATPQNLPLPAFLKDGNSQRSKGGGSECFPLPTPSSLITSYVSFLPQPLAASSGRHPDHLPHPTPGKVRCTSSVLTQYLRLPTGTLTTFIFCLFFQPPLYTEGKNCAYLAPQRVPSVQVSARNTLVVNTHLING